MSQQKATLEDVRRLYADMMAAASGSDDPRIARAFEAVPREAFLPPGPWIIPVTPWTTSSRTVQTPTADPVHLYQNVLVCLDARLGINNGEPQLHAAWIGAVAPRPDETVVHIGAGTGYYTAILSMLVLPNGTVRAYEVNRALAQTARRNLEPFDGVTVKSGNAVELPIPACDIIYVNAGVVAPPRSWLLALNPGGRMIFPWRPTEKIGLAALVTRMRSGWAFKPLMHAWFISCIGASNADAALVAPDYVGAWRTRSVRLTREETPDASATAIYEDVWFSDQPP